MTTDLKNSQSNNQDPGTELFGNSAATDYQTGSELTPDNNVSEDNEQQIIDPEIDDVSTEKEVMTALTEPNEHSLQIRKPIKKSFIQALTIALICLGLMIATQYKTQQILLNDLSQQSDETLISLIKQLYDKQYNLTVELLDLEKQMDNYRENSEQDDSLEDTLQNELSKMKIVNGTIAVSGPGLNITVGSGLSGQDLIEIINDLWNSGAEAVAVNNIRFTNYSVITYDPLKRLISMDGTTLSAPFTILAVGDSDTLSRGVQIPGGIIDELIVYYNLQVKITPIEKVVLPAATANQEFSYAQNAEENTAADKEETD